MPGCKSRKRLQAHHIERWADSPGLRYDVSNGITLCSNCHYEIRNNEKLFAQMFNEIVKRKKK